MDVSTKRAEDGMDPANNSERSLNDVPPSAHAPRSVESQPLRSGLAEAAVPGEGRLAVRWNSNPVKGR
jgi:hypothetical protein